MTFSVDDEEKVLVVLYWYYVFHRVFVVLKLQAVYHELQDLIQYTLSLWQSASLQVRCAKKKKKSTAKMCEAVYGCHKQPNQLKLKYM